MDAKGHEPKQAASLPPEPSYSFPTIPRPSWRKRLHRAVREFEPWGVLLAVIGLLLSLLAFWADYADRVEERTVRAWQLLTTSAPGNSGKIEALEYLNRQDGVLCVDWEWLNGCLLPLKARTELVGIDLSQPDNGTPDDPTDDPAGAYLIGVDLHNAGLFGANLHGANLIEGVLKGANLMKANLSRANLGGAVLIKANLFKANLRGANLVSAELDSANLDGADLSEANLVDVVLSGADLSKARSVSQKQLDGACGDEHTQLPAGLTIRLCRTRPALDDAAVEKRAE